MSHEPAQGPDDGRYVAGDTIGHKYVLQSPIGEGGMGIVWNALNRDLGTRVAIKLIHAVASSTTLGDRLLKEARILGRLEHPGIVRVFDLGSTAHGDPYIVMELLSGESLAELAARGPMDSRRAVQLMLPIAEALEVAHARGIVHRDLKPENIFVADVAPGRVQPKVLDFGIAHSSHDLNLRLTKPGTLVGSPVYMSPEQARGATDVDARADIWAFCVVLYELLTGAAPYEAINYNATLRAIIEHEPVPLALECPGDDGLWEIIRRGLAKDPAERWQSVHELGLALARWLYERGIDEDAAHSALRSAWLSSPSLLGVDEQPFSLVPTPLPPPLASTTGTVAGLSQEPVRSARSRWAMVATLLTVAIAAAAMVLVLRVERNESPANAGGAVAAADAARSDAATSASSTRAAAPKQDHADPNVETERPAKGVPSRGSLTTATGAKKRPQPSAPRTGSSRGQKGPTRPSSVDGPPDPAPTPGAEPKKFRPREI